MIVFFLLLLFLALMLMSYFVVTYFMGGGPKLWVARRCDREHLVPVAEAAERYFRDKGHYPEHIEDVYPVYLSSEEILRCPADTTSHPGKSSFTYTRPDAAHPDRPMLVCTHHPPFDLKVMRQGDIDPGHTRWIVLWSPREADLRPPPPAK